MPIQRVTVTSGPAGERQRTVTRGAAAAPLGWVGVKSARRTRVIAALVAVLLVAAAFAVPQFHLGIVTPLIRSTGQADPDVRRDGPHLRVVGAPRGMGHRSRHRHRVRDRAVGPGAGPSAAVAGRAVGDVGGVGRLGVLAGDDRRVAAGVRGSPGDDQRVSATGAVGHRHSLRGPLLLVENPRLPTTFVDHPRVGPPTGRPADVRVARPHRPRRWNAGPRSSAC